MPDRKFLQEFPLYRKFKMKLPETLDEVPQPTIKMFCEKCGTEQTFRMTNEYYDEYMMLHRHKNIGFQKISVKATYICVHCNEFIRDFFMMLSKDEGYVMKIGQFPAWSVSGDPHVELCSVLTKII